METVYRFKGHLRVVPAGESLVFLVGESERFLLTGRLYRLVAPLVDGRRTVAQIASELADRVAPAEVLYALHLLRDRGYTTDAAAHSTPERMALYEAVGLVAPDADVSAAVEGVAGADPSVVAAALLDAAIASRESSDFRVLVTRDYLEPELAAAAARCERAGVRWMPIKVTGPSAWIGPVFGRGAGACWACVTHRLRSNRPDRVFVERRATARADVTPPVAETPATLQAGARLAALEALRVLLSPREGGRTASQRLLTLDHCTLLAAEHPVVRRPQCPVCGDADAVRRRSWAPVRLERRAKIEDADGGFRCATADETFERLRRQIDPLTGIVPYVVPAVGRDHPLRPVYASAYAACPSHDDPAFDEFGRAALGKGRAPAQARVGALAEAIERHSALFQGDEAFVRATVAELAGEAVHPDELQGFSRRQYTLRAETNERVRDRRRRVPVPFDASVAIHWTPAWSLTEDRRRYVPATYAYLYAGLDEEAAACPFNPNGHAAGTCVEEAILQAFLELAERDAVAVWWYNRLARPEVHLDSFGEPYFDALRAHYARLGHRVWVLDVTNDLDVPAFVALARADDGGRWCAGFGAHLEARIAVQRALTELNQLFDPTGGAPPPWDAAALGDDAFLFPRRDEEPRQASRYARADTDDVSDDVRACVDRARRVGLETMVIDQTRPDTGLSVVQVVVPGLRHIWPRLGPGRLYDVPVALGWRSRPAREEDLNPVPLFV